MLYIMRHGMTSWNSMHRLQGRTDIPLNDEGREMARKAHDEYFDVHFDVCYCSELKRSKETAELVIGERDIPIISDKRLNEMSFGACEGVFDYLHSIQSPVYALFKDPGNYNDPPKDAESIEMLCERTGEFLNEVVYPQLEEGKDILIVGHGAMNSSIVMQVKNLPKSEFWSAGLEKCKLLKLL